MVFAPSACVQLADFGAQVIKVEPTGSGDLNRVYHQLPGMPVSDLPYTFQMDNRNKKSIALDLKSAAGYAAFCKLLADADVFVTNYRASALSRLKLTYDDLVGKNPRLVYAVATAHGERGEEKDKAGYDSVSYWTRSAIDTSVFPMDGWLGAFPFGSGDHPSGTSLFAAIMLGLFQRQQSGKGCKVSSSLLANGAWANATLFQAKLGNAEFKERRPRAQSWNFTNQHYRTKDGRLLRLSIVNIEKDWPPFCIAMGAPELAKDSRFLNQHDRENNMSALIAFLDSIFAQQDVHYWGRVLDEHDIPSAIVPTYDEAVNDPQKAANDIVVPMNHKRFGAIRTVSSPFEIAGVKKEPPVAAPELGEHTQEVLKSLGYSDAQVQALLEQGVAQQYKE